MLAYLHGWEATCEVEPRWVHHLALCLHNNTSRATNICQQQCAEVVDNPGFIAARISSAEVQSQQRPRLTLHRPAGVSNHTNYSLFAGTIVYNYHAIKGLELTAS